MSNEFRFNFGAERFPAPPKNANQIPQTNQIAIRVAAALRAGGFACLFSEIIEPTWGATAGRIAGFPARIHFTALPTEPESDPACAFVVSTYCARPETYREDGEEKTLRYVSELESEHSVEVTYCKDRNSWKATKYRGDTAILWSTGKDLRRLQIQLACGKVDAGEAALPVSEDFDLKEAMGVIGAYTFTPS